MQPVNQSALVIADQIVKNGISLADEISPIKQPRASRTFIVCDNNIDDDDQVYCLSRRYRRGGVVSCSDDKKDDKDSYAAVMIGIGIVACLSYAAYQVFMQCPRAKWGVDNTRALQNNLRTECTKKPCDPDTIEFEIRRTAQRIGDLQVDIYSERKRSILEKIAISTTGAASLCLLKPILTLPAVVRCLPELMVRNFDSLHNVGICGVTICAGVIAAKILWENCCNGFYEAKVREIRKEAAEYHSFKKLVN